MTVIEKAKELVDGGGTNGVTTSQLRKFLSAVNSVTNKVQICKEQVLPTDLINEIQYLRVKLAYQAGRYKEVKEFAINSDLDRIIQVIKTKDDYLNFARYVEAIIAFHKFNKGE
jgi:CRISPR-associated protein Csm2